MEGRIRIVDIDTGGDHTLTPGDYDGYVWQNPWFSPDGRRILVYRFIQGTTTSQMAILASDGSGAATDMVQRPTTRRADAMYSPDGTTIVVTYSNVAETWRSMPMARMGIGRRSPAIRGQSWQRRGR